MPAPSAWLSRCWRSGRRPTSSPSATCCPTPSAASSRGRPVRTSFIQRLPFARKHFRKYLGLMPIAIEQFDLAGYDLVVSSNHAVAKGVITGPGQLHVSYVHSPMRYAWDLQHQYLRQAGLEHGPMSLYTRWLLHQDAALGPLLGRRGRRLRRQQQLHRRADREGLAPPRHRHPPAGRRRTLHPGRGAGGPLPDRRPHGALQAGRAGGRGLPRHAAAPAGGLRRRAGRRPGPGGRRRRAQHRAARPGAAGRAGAADPHAPAPSSMRRRRISASAWSRPRPAARR